MKALFLAIGLGTDPSLRFSFSFFIRLKPKIFLAISNILLCTLTFALQVDIIFWEEFTEIRDLKKKFFSIFFFKNGCTSF